MREGIAAQEGGREQDTSGKERAIIVPSGGRVLDSDVFVISSPKMAHFCRRHTFADRQRIWHSLAPKVNEQTEDLDKLPSWRHSSIGERSKEVSPFYVLVMPIAGKAERDNDSGIDASLGAEICL